MCTENKHWLTRQEESIFEISGEKKDEKQTKVEMVISRLMTYLVLDSSGYD